MSSLRFRMLAVCALVVGFLPAGFLSAQGDPADAGKLKPDPEVQRQLANLKEIVADKKMGRDAEGGQVIDLLTSKVAAGLAEKDRKDIAKGLEGVFTGGKLREPASIQLYVAAAAALGTMGNDGSKPLKAAFDNKRFPNKPEWVKLREALLRNLGKTKDESMVKFLCEEARRSPEPQLMAAAGEALGNFEGSDQKVRKEIVNNLLIRYGELDSRSRVLDSADIEAQNARDYLAVISDKWNSTLGRLTGQNFRQYPDWNTWFNKNRAADWSK